MSTANMRPKDAEKTSLTWENISCPNDDKTHDKYPSRERS
jgi:hypothetical protein